MGHVGQFRWLIHEVKRILTGEIQWQDWSFQTQTHKPAAATVNLPFPDKPSMKPPTGAVDIGVAVTGWSEASERSQHPTAGTVLSAAFMFTHSLMEL